jgi:hypothetical protein
LNSIAPELELMLLLAGTQARRGATRDRAEALAGHVDPAALVDLLTGRRLLPLIGSRLLDVAPGTMPANFVAAVDRSRESTRRHGLGVETLTRRIVARLEDAGIPTLPLKGPVLASAIYGDCGMRMTHDVDLLVPAGRLHAAVGLVRAEGYGAPREPGGAAGLPELHFELSHPGLPPVELHWRVHWYEREFSRDMLERSQAVDGELRRPVRGDELVALLLFYARDGFYGLRHAADLAAWWDLHAGEAEHGWLDKHAAAYPRLAPALRAAATSLERTTGVPSGAVMSGPSRASARERRAVRLAAWSGRGDTDQLRANMSLVRGLLGSRGSYLSFVRHDVFPPAGDLGAIQDGLSGAARGLGSRLAHAAKRVTRYGLALWSTRGGREWEPLPPGLR